MKKLPHHKKKVRRNDRDYGKKKKIWTERNERREEKKKVKVEGKRFKVAGRVVTETSIGTNASTRCGYVLSGQSQAQRAASLCAATLDVFP